MGSDIAEVLETAKALRRDQIADLAHELLRVLDADDASIDQADIDAAWRQEIHRRVDELESGTVKLVDHDETVAAARAILASRTS